VRGKPIIEVSDEEQSILSHAKTPLPKIRSNPAIFLQECVSNIQSANCQGRSANIITTFISILISI